MSRGYNESAPKLYIEFEDDDAAAITGEAELVSDRELVDSGLVAWAPRWQPGRIGHWSWRAVPTRYRKVVAGAVALVGLATAIGDSLAAQAAQRAADRSSVAVADAAYSPSADGNGLDLLVDVTDTGGSDVTVTQAQVKQSDLNLGYLGEPLDLAAHQQLEIVLWGQYDCTGGPVSSSSSSTAGGGSPATMLRLTVRSSQGNVDTVDLPLPASAQMPYPWRDGRAVYCTWVWGNQP